MKIADQNISAGILRQNILEKANEALEMGLINKVVKYDELIPGDFIVLYFTDCSSK